MYLFVDFVRPAVDNPDRLTGTGRINRQTGWRLVRRVDGPATDQGTTERVFEYLVARTAVDCVVLNGRACGPIFVSPIRAPVVDHIELSLTLVDAPTTAMGAVFGPPAIPTIRTLSTFASSSAALTFERKRTFKLADLYGVTRKNRVHLDDKGVGPARIAYVKRRSRNASVESATFSRAIMRHVNLEQVDLSQGVFDRALMQGALLTASRAQGASFRAARLREAGMAEILWEDCDLREADLRGVAFHMGSTRCGLVGSPYPSHGTRTGFYTDEHDDLNYKPPEQIRKACLVGCDLRGANIENVDFYLVDLRGAKFDRRHRKHLAACGAILDED